MESDRQPGRFFFFFFEWDSARGFSFYGSALLFLSDANVGKWDKLEENTFTWDKAFSLSCFFSL
jgi:hypothetical protein